MLNSCGVVVDNQRLVRAKSGSLYVLLFVLNNLMGTTNRLTSSFSVAFKQVMDSYFDRFISLTFNFMPTMHRPYNNNYMYIKEK